MAKSFKTAMVRARPGDDISLRDIDPGDTGDYSDKDEAPLVLAKLHERLADLQMALYAECKRSVLVVLQAMDTGGKDGATTSLMQGVNPTGAHIASFKAPSSLELSHDFLWRIHQQVPPRGYIGIWNRSHYEDVLIARVHKLVEKRVWKGRYQHINNFEELLHDSGVTVLKFFLHISRDEQKERLQARLADPEKLWKFNLGDLKERELWGDYQEAYQDAINACTTSHAPWHIVPADHKWARDIAIATAVVEALKKLDPKYPSTDLKPEKIKID